jgi:FemAB-related protein (PEP-CTERM system-associated)
VIEQAFGHRTFYIMAERDGDVTGVLPLTFIKSRLFGSRLVSNAFVVEGGPVAADSITMQALEAKAVQLMDDLRAPVLEFRSGSAVGPDWVNKNDLYASFRKYMPPSPEENMKLIPRKQRAMVRKGISNGLKSEIDDDVDCLHRLYSESVRNLGTPTFSHRYFRILRNTFREKSDIVTITSNGKPVASVLNFYFRDQVLPYYGGGSGSARELAANDFMYWEVMRRACERGFRLFDFGRSKCGTGAYEFKKHWGFEPVPLTYQFRLAPGQKIPEINPMNPKLRLFIALWKKLPLAMSIRLGPPIVRALG